MAIRYDFLPIFSPPFTASIHGAISAAASQSPRNWGETRPGGRLGWRKHTHGRMLLRHLFTLESYTWIFKNCRDKKTSNTWQYLTFSCLLLSSYSFQLQRAKRDKHIIIILQHLPNWLYTSRKLPCFQKSASFNWDIWKLPTSMVNGKLHHIPKRACAQVHCKAKWPT